MLLRYTDHLGKTDVLKKPYRGVVVSNEDPRKQGRLKVRIDGLLPTADITLLPWIYPKSPPGLGGGGTTSSFAVPIVGSEVEIEFPFNDIYSGKYTGIAQSASTHSGIFDENYPNSYGFRDQQGTTFKVNTAKKVMEFLHASGAETTIEKDGTIEFRTPAKFRIVSTDDKSFIEFDMSTGDVKYNSKGQTEFSGEKVKISPTQLEYEVGSVKEKVLGGKDTQIIGGLKTVVGGTLSEAVVSNKVSSIGGSYTKLVTQQQDETLGLGLKRTIVAGGILDTILLGNVTQLITAGNFTQTALVGTISMLATAGTISLTAGAGLNLTTTASFSLIAATGATIQTAAGVTVQAAATVSITTLADMSISAAAGVTATTAAAVSVTAGAGITLTASAAMTLIGSMVNIGTTPIGRVVTTISDPVEDFITGVPKIGCSTVMAGP